MKGFRFISVLKRNIFSFSCLALAALVSVTGALSYAKYISGDPADPFSGIGSFSVSASVDGVSGLSFTNTAFWSNTDDDDKVALNALRALNFSVNNFETDESGNKSVSDVKLNYTLTFSSPKSFAEKLAVQVFNGSGDAVLPQVVIADILKAAGGEYNTASSNDYNGASASELIFSVKKESDTLYTATSGKTVITVEEYEKEISQTLLFRAWDCSSLTSETQKETEIEGGKILSPVELTYTQSVPLYRISVSMEDFVLPAGIEATVNYTVKLAPTDMVSDIHLGGTLVKATDAEGAPVDYEKVKEIYGGSGETWYIKSTSEATTETYYDNSNFTGTVLSAKYTPMSPVTGSVITYEDGATSTVVSTSEAKPVSGTETVETYEFKESEIAWKKYTVKSTEPTLEDYNKNHITVAHRNPDKYNTDFYIHKLNATRTGTQTVTYTHTKTTVTPTDGEKVVKQTEVTEKTDVQRLDGEGETVLLNITRTTETEYTGNFKVETETTVTKCTRTYMQSGFIYRGYYVESETGGLNYWNSDSEKTLVEYKNGKFTDNKYSVETMNVESESHTESEATTTTLTDTKDAATSVKTIGYEYLQKKVEREYNYYAIVIDKAEQAQTDDSGVSQAKVSFTKESPLVLFDESGIQKYCVAQCYSKSYPFFVNVIFEQAQ